MGLALPSEMNGYPGPVHVLELADQLQLSAEQRQRIQQLFEAMKREAIAVGETLIQQESALEPVRRAKISPDMLTQLTEQIGETQDNQGGSSQISPHNGGASHHPSKIDTRSCVDIAKEGQSRHRAVRLLA